MSHSVGSQICETSHYALLVGINGYPNPKNRLNGAVRDAQEFKVLLNDSVEHASVKILTATQSEHTEAFNPSEDRECWPTYDNITAEFNRILAQAPPHSFVYVHFSGHGSHGPSGDNNARETMPLALCVLSGEEGPKPPNRYLWGSELASILKAMVDRELVVTLVLDCCFSGSVKRSDNNGLRFLEYEPNVDAAFPMDSSKSLPYADDIAFSKFRKASMLPNWLANPAGYTVLTACGPTQRALEIRDEASLQHGMLSYFLLRACKQFGGLGCSLGILFQHLQAMIQERAGTQMPCLLGNRTLGLFGRNERQPGFFEAHVAVRRGSDNEVRIPIGEAQNVSLGDLFKLSPLGAKYEGSRRAVTGCVVQVTPLHSVLGPYDAEDDLGARTGWLAQPLTRTSFQRYPVRILSSVPQRDEIENALGKEGFMISPVGVDSQQTPFCFINHSGTDFSILESGTDKTLHLPERPMADANTKGIRDVLEHLIRYQLAKESVSVFQIDISLPYQVYMESNGMRFEAGASIHVSHDDDIYLNVHNNGPHDIYLFVFGFWPFWEVQHIFKRSHSVVPPSQPKRRKITMTVPPGLLKDGQMVSHDLIKVFITTQFTSFNILELPSLGDKMEEIQVRSKESKRGDSDISKESCEVFDFPVRVIKPDAVDQP
ncbi:caspase [Apiospora rasikravindrae]|uniref:Caspase n=1 Tax=Apiospora rasikravindrae TaxID=990691 RepID=A0ABR1RPF4_9PEZI